MTRLTWGSQEHKEYHRGVDRGVFYDALSLGASWSGLLSVESTNPDSELTNLYVDGEVKRKTQRPGKFEARIEAYTYPEVLLEYEGVANKYITSQKSRYCSMSFRTMVDDEHYQLHLIYNILLLPSDVDNESMGETDQPIVFAWDIVTKPSKVEGMSYASHFIIDSRYSAPRALLALENILYGDVDNNPRLVSIEELLELFDNLGTYLIIDHGDGTWTAEGPDEAFTIIGDYFELEWPNVTYLSNTEYRIGTW